MTTRTVQKNLATQEDLAFGEVGITQTRGTGSYPLTPVRLIYPCNSIAERDALDPLSFPKAVVLIGTTATFYSYFSDTWNEVDNFVDFGLGVTDSATLLLDSDEARVSGSYRFTSSDPSSPNATNGSFSVKVYSTGVVHQVAFIASTETVMIRRWNGTVWASWVEFLTEANAGTAALADVTTSSTDNTIGRVVKIANNDGWFGLGSATSPPVVADIEAADIPNGIYSTSSGSFTASNPTSRTTNGLLALSDTARNFEFLYNVDEQFLFRVGDTGVWNDWLTIFHSGNTNLNTFGGVANNDIIATGIGVSGTAVRFLLPISLFAAPSSITVTGTFLVSDGGGVVDTGITPTISSVSSNKMCVITCTGTGFTSGAMYVLQCESAASEIVVNP